MKKKRSFKIAVTCFVFFVFFFVFQINLCALSRSRNATRSSNINPGRKHLKLKTVWLNRTSLPPPPPSQASPQARKINCDRSNKAYDLCTIHGPTFLDPTVSTFYLVDPQSQGPSPPLHSMEKIRPYPRKWETVTMNRIKELTLTSGPSSPPCQVHHNVPALVFSAGGYTGNFFHDFNDGLIPLFITVKTVFSDDQDFVLVISKARDWWVSKYADLLRAFSKYPIINLDNDSSTHCFPSANIGLVSHGFMTINPKLLPNSQSFTHFHALLDKAYGHHQNQPSEFNSARKRPRLVITSRSGSVGRLILNQNEVKKIAQNIGFDVTVFEPTPHTPLREAYALINSSHAMIGVHGAALTHSLFLRPGSVFLQVVPLGNEKVDPVASQGKNWSDTIMSIYLKEQNVRLDLLRFREYLKKAYKKSKKFMEKEG
eukprot:XP_025015389.1 uncharacterized protein LOC8289152 [Ricinus communis]